MGKMEKRSVYLNHGCKSISLIIRLSNCSRNYKRVINHLLISIVLSFLTINVISMIFFPHFLINKNQPNQLIPTQ